MIKWIGLALALWALPAQAQTTFPMPPPAGVVVLGVQVVATCGAASLGTTQPAYVAMNAQGQLCTNAGAGGGTQNVNITQVLGAPLSASNPVFDSPQNSGDIIVNPNAASASFTRPGNTTPYASGQLVANSVTAGSVVPLSWTASRVAAGNFRITRTRMMLSGKSITNTNFRVHYFSATTTVSNGDGGTFVPTTAALEVCEMDVTVALAGADVSIGYGAANQGVACDVALASGSTLFGYVEARAAYTPVSAETITVVPEIHQN